MNNEDSFNTELKPENGSQDLSAGTILNTFNVPGDRDLRTFNPLVLAHVGDAVYELIIRTILAEKMDTQVQDIHKKCTELVNCHAQCELLHKIEERLTEEELAVFKRGRNTKAHTMPKNAAPYEYRTSTGFEALCGWLYLSGKTYRLYELLRSELDIKE